MSQKLILPINACRVTAGYKNANYKRDFGYTHFGVDYTDQQKKDKTVWASGVGEVVKTGWSPACGNVIIVVYKDCLLTDGTVRDLTIRYYHLEKILCKKGQKTTKDTRLAIYGSTGHSTGDHLHLEIDKDTRYFDYTPQISRDSGVLKKGTDTTLNPSICLYVKTTAPDSQSIKNSGYDTVAQSDYKLKKY